MIPVSFPHNPRIQYYYISTAKSIRFFARNPSSERYCAQRATLVILPAETRRYGIWKQLCAFEFYCVGTRKFALPCSLAL